MATDAITKEDFSGGWNPSMDEDGGPDNQLPVMSNVELDAQGSIQLRQGSTKLYTSLSGAPGNNVINGIYSAILGGNLIRMIGIGNRVYANGVQLSLTMASTGDILFGSYLGQILFARATSNYKYDGILRTWGIPKPTGAPSVAAITSNSRTLTSFDKVESGWTWNGALYGTWVDNANKGGTADKAKKLTSDSTSGRGCISGYFTSAAVDFSKYSDNELSTDDDLFQFDLYLTDANLVSSLTVDIDVGGVTASYAYSDFYSKTLTYREVIVSNEDQYQKDLDQYNRTIESMRKQMNNIPYSTPGYGNLIAQIQHAMDMIPKPGHHGGSSVASGDALPQGWNVISIRKGDFERHGSNVNLNWSTVRGLRITLQCTTGGAASEVIFDNLNMIGGATKALSGTYKARICYAKQFTDYLEISPPSAVSADIGLTMQGLTVSVPYAVWSARDTQLIAGTDKIYVYLEGSRFGGIYKFGDAVIPASGTAPLDITLSINDVTALTAAISLDLNDDVPPTGIIGIEGPYYDRTFCLTSNLLYPSRRLKPETYNLLQAVTVGDGSETALWVKKSLMGLYIGTTKDIYVLRGTGAEYPDGSIDFVLQGLNVGKPPVSSAVCSDGNVVFYQASDGIRALQGITTQLLNGTTDLLWRGYDKFGFTHIDKTGRLRMTYNQDCLYVIMPENGVGSAVGSPVLYRLGKGQWTRRVYPNTISSLFSEPDGQLVSGDNQGNFWLMNIPNYYKDYEADLPVLLQTKFYDGEDHYSRKDANDLAIIYGSSSSSALSLFADGGSTAVWTINNAGVDTVPYLINVETMGIFTHASLRISGSFNSFVFRGFSLSFRKRPRLTRFYENRPLEPDVLRNRFGGLDIIIDTLGNDAIVTPLLDDVEQAAFVVNTNDALLKNLTFPSVVGRDLWARIEGTGFELFSLTPIKLQDKIQIIQGQLPSTDAGYAGEKVINGTTIRLCTMGATRIITPMYDGILDDETFPVQTAIDEYKTFTLNPTKTKTATECGLFVDGDVELLKWTPNVMYRLPIATRIWDTGFVDVSGGKPEIIWPTEIKIKVKSPASLIVLAYFDDVSFGNIVVPVTPNVFSLFPVNVPQGFKGWQPRFVVVASGNEEFNPAWIQLKYRPSGASLTDEKAYFIQAMQTGGE